ncbi:MAG: acyl-CoA dehydrogenase [Rhodospirillales bacterium]|nr:acyl-CoA dehydrogenase [Rhodospirillales bacterium]
MSSFDLTARASERQEMIRRAWDLVPAIADRAAETENLRQLHPDTVRDFHETGLWKIVQPARIGGGEFDYGLIVEITDIVGRGCGSTGWLFSNLSSHHWMMAQWPEQAQNVVWSDNPDTLIATSLIYPAGKLTPVDGGYELTGRWPFCSGIDICDWIMVGALVQTDDGPPEPRMVVVAKSDLELIDTWQVSGLAGTGSKDTACEKLFIPDHMTLGAREVRGDPTPGAAVNPSPLYRMPVLALFSHLISGPILGMAAGLNDSALDFFKARVSAYNASKVADHTTVHLKLAKAGVMIDSARLLLKDNCREAAEFAWAGTMPPDEAKMRWRRDSAYAAQLCGKAGSMLFHACGGSGIYDKSPLQRQLRDLNAGMVHIGVSFDVNGVGYGRVALGLEPDNPNV